MKWITRLSYIIFLTGFLLKFFHVHYNAILMIVGMAGLFISFCVSVSRKETRYESIFHLVILLWLVQLFISVKFFPLANSFIWIASGVTLLFLLMILKQKQIIRSIPVIPVAIIAFVIWSMPRSDRYKMLNINWNHELDTDHITWDKYSWFLYIDGRYDEAVSASNKALEIAQSLNDEHWIRFITEHNNAIKERDWDRYR